MCEKPANPSHAVETCRGCAETKELIHALKKQVEKLMSLLVQREMLKSPEPIILCWNCGKSLLKDDKKGQDDETA